MSTRYSVNVNAYNLQFLDGHGNSANMTIDKSGDFLVTNLNHNILIASSNDLYLSSDNGGSVYINGVPALQDVTALEQAISVPAVGTFVSPQIEITADPYVNVFAPLNMQTYQPISVTDGDTTTQILQDGGWTYILNSAPTNGVYFNQAIDNDYFELSNTGVLYQYGSTVLTQQIDSSGNLDLTGCNAYSFDNNVDVATDVFVNGNSTGLQAQITALQPCNNVTFWHDASTVQSGNAIQISIDGNQNYYSRSSQTPSTSTDQFYQAFSYGNSTNANITVLGCLLSTGGVFNVSIDGNIVGTWNGYISTAQNNNIQVIGPLTINAGAHTLTFSVQSAGGSGGYDCSITKINIQG